MSDLRCVADDVVMGEKVHLAKFINLYGCRIGDRSKLGTFVEVQRCATIGADCKISSHTFVCEGVHIGDGCFVGHGVMFINDREPQAVNADGSMERDDDWRGRFVETVVEDRVSIGTAATILGGVRIGRGALIAAGAVVTRDVPAGEVWVGNPARKLRRR